MWEDPIVAEVHRIREKLAAEHNFDVKAIFADLRKRQAALGERLVRQKRRTGQKKGRKKASRASSDGNRASESE